MLGVSWCCYENRTAKNLLEIRTSLWQHCLAFPPRTPLVGPRSINSLSAWEFAYMKRLMLVSASISRLVAFMKAQAKTKVSSPYMDAHQQTSKASQPS